MMRRKSDILWKGMIEEVFDDLLRFFFPKADQVFDIQRGFEFHIEVQDKNEPAFAKRMFQYYCRIFDRFDKPMTAIAIFTGRDERNLPNRYERIYEGSELIYKYNIYFKIRAVEAKAEGRLEEKIEMVKRLFRSKEFSIKKIASFVEVSVYFVEKIRQGKKIVLNKSSILP